MYIWKRGKKACVHILNPSTSKSWCKTENSGTRFSYHDLAPPEGRRICTLCEQLKSSADKKIENPVFRKETGKQSANNFYNSREWHKLRYTAFLKYGRKCLVCGADHKKGARLHVDHIKPISKYPDLALSLDNLQILCALCNSGKGAWDETDWREDQGNKAMDALENEMNSHMQDIFSS